MMRARVRKDEFKGLKSHPAEAAAPRPPEGAGGSRSRARAGCGGAEPRSLGALLPGLPGLRFSPGADPSPGHSHSSAAPPGGIGNFPSGHGELGSVLTDGVPSG